MAADDEPFPGNPTLQSEVSLDGDTQHTLLIVRCQLCEAEALDRLVSLWHKRLWRYLRALLPDDDTAGEAIQNVWLQILRGLPRLRDPRRFNAWAYRIAHHVAMDHLRVKYAAPLTEPLDADEHMQHGEIQPTLDDDLEALHAGLHALPLIERTVLSLFYLQELTLAEIAEVADIPIGTVKSRLFRARRQLRELMLSAQTETRHV